MHEMDPVPINEFNILWVAPLIACCVVTNLVHIPDMACGPMPRSRGLETQRGRETCAEVPWQGDRDAQAVPHLS